MLADLVKRREKNKSTAFSISTELLELTINSEQNLRAYINELRCKETQESESQQSQAHSAPSVILTDNQGGTPGMASAGAGGVAASGVEEGNGRASRRRGGVAGAQASGENRGSGRDMPNGGGRVSKRSAAVAASRKVRDILVTPHQAGPLNGSCAVSSSDAHEREGGVAAPLDTGGGDTTSSSGGGSGSSGSSISDSGDEDGPDNGTTHRADDNARKAGVKRRRSQTRMRAHRHGSGSASSTSASSTSMPQDYLWEQLERLPCGRSSCTSMTHGQGAMQGAGSMGTGKDSTSAAAATQEGTAPATIQRRGTGRRGASRGGGSSRGRGSGSCCKKGPLATGLFFYSGLSDDGVGQAALSGMHPYYRGVGAISNKEQQAPEPALAQSPRSISAGQVCVCMRVFVLSSVGVFVARPE